MGTRAAFLIGDPCKMSASGEPTAKLVGTTAWDGSDAIPLLAKAKSADQFKMLVQKEVPKKCSGFVEVFPFPWPGDLFLTDMVYAWFAPDDRPEGAYFQLPDEDDHKRSYWMPCFDPVVLKLAKRYDWDGLWKLAAERKVPMFSSSKVRAPGPFDRSQDTSVIIVGVKR